MTAALFPDLIVNGEVVPHAAIAAEVQNHAAPPGKPGLAWRRAANAVAIRVLLLQEARRRGLGAEPIEAGPGRRETDEEALVRSLLEAEVAATPPTEADIRAEYDRDPGRFRSPPLWEVSHILVACDPADAGGWGLARVRAEALAREAAAGPEAFARLARSASDCGSAAQGGALGQLGPGDTLPEFEAALRRLAAGEVTDAPVPTRHGWHVIRLDAVAPGQVLPYAAARPRIAEALEKAAWARSARALVARLVAAADIVGADLRPV